MNQPRITEAQFQATVVAMARTLGWRAFHPYDARRSRQGWPDLALWKPGAFLLRELKTDTGTLTNAQVVTLDELRRAGVNAAVWRPKDWDTIEATLKAPNGNPKPKRETP